MNWRLPLGGTSQTKKRGLGAFKRRMQWKVTGVIAGSTLFFVLLYVPEEVLGPLAEKLTLLNQVLIKSGFTVPVIYLFHWILFAQDHLATGNSLASIFFRHYYVSNYAVAERGLKQDDANKQWFDYFNKWEDEGNPNHRYYLSNFGRTYDCRLVFYLKRVLVVFIIAASLSTWLTLWLFNSQDSHRLLPARISIIILYALLLGSLHLSNRAPKNPLPGSYDDRYLPTGVYARYKEIAGILRSKFEEDVLSKTRPSGGC